MTKFLLKKIILLTCCMIVATMAKAQAPVINSAVPSTNVVGKYDKFEVKLNHSAFYVNPYDYDEVEVTASFTSPGGRTDVVDGFFMQEYNLNNNGFAVTVGTGSFHLRYAPNETGTWTYVITCKNSFGTTTMPAANFTCVPSAAPGFIRSNTSNYLSFDNGMQHIPIGENMGWQNGSIVADYSNWVTDLSNNGGNFIRVWMSSWAFALEWKNGTNGFEGLKKYKQTSAFYLDWLLDYCKQKNVYMMLALNNHGQVSTNVNPEWSNNPYNIANGGPATNTWDFFTNNTAKALHKNRLRYIVARYGYSQNIQSWELFNELHWTDQFETRKNDLTAWDNEMASFLKQKDVYKHLVTTSYGGDEIDTETWNLPNIDFTQTHFYVNAPNIETVLAAANQTFLNKYNKPTLNGEFGLGPEGNVLSADDPNGIHVHNALWASMFSGGLGAGLTWWWDTYVEPRNLYYHFKGLSAFTSLINFRQDHYTKVPATATGNGGSDATISPGADWGKAPAANFTIDASGAITPGPSALSKFLYGSTYNTQHRNPPTFTVNYPSAGQFKVVVSGVSNDAPKITIYLDGVQMLNANAVAGQTYTIDVPAGQHLIKVDNLGIDWAQLSSFVFTNVGSPLAAYVLQSQSKKNAAGYVLNTKYNWQYLKASSAVPPPPVTGGVLTIPGMANGSYTVLLYNTLMGEEIASLPVTVSNTVLTVQLPDVAWDVAFRAVENSTLPVRLHAFRGERINMHHQLHIEIASSENVRAIYLERSANGTDFTTLHPISNTWSTIAGKHMYVDASPLRDANYYRLRIVDNDGTKTYSGVIKLINKNTAVQVYPNPFTKNISVHVYAGKYQVKIADQSGKTMMTKAVSTSAEQVINFETGTLARGVYYVVLTDAAGNIIAAEKVMK